MVFKRGGLASHFVTPVARPVVVCNGCGAMYLAPKKKGEPKPHKRLFPWKGQCMNCGRMDTTFFATMGEGQRWAELLLRQSSGVIKNIRRQVRYPLFTVNEETGAKMQFGEYISDFVYDDVESGKTIIEDFKPAAGSDRLAALKLECMRVSGRPVKIITSKGAV